jgi:hypothetical protein
MHAPHIRYDPPDKIYNVGVEHNLHLITTLKSESVYPNNAEKKRDVREGTAVKIDFLTPGGVRYMTPASDDYRDLPPVPPRTEPASLYIKAIDVVSSPFIVEDDDEEKVYYLIKSGLLSKRAGLKGRTILVDVKVLVYTFWRRHNTKNG